MHFYGNFLSLFLYFWKDLNLQNIYYVPCGYHLFFDNWKCDETYREPIFIEFLWKILGFSKSSQKNLLNYSEYPPSSTSSSLVLLYPWWPGNKTPTHKNFFQRIFFVSCKKHPFTYRKIESRNDANNSQWIVAFHQCMARSFTLIDMPG